MTMKQPDPLDPDSAWYACRWRQDNNGIWETSCGNAFEFNANGPKENRMRFCCYCGKLLRVAAVA